MGCPVCGSERYGGSPKNWKMYSERGRLDVTYNRCDDCGAAWDAYHYVREGVTEDKHIRRGDGNLQAWGDLPAPHCHNCQSLEVQWLYEEGRWRKPGISVLRYECRACGEIWLEMAQDEDGTRVAYRVWRRGRGRK